MYRTNLSTFMHGLKTELPNKDIIFLNYVFWTFNNGIIIVECILIYSSPL